MARNSLPLLREGIDEILDGVFVKCPTFCKSQMNKWCIEYYESIKSCNEGLRVCPFGFNSYIIKISNRTEIFTAFRVMNEYNVKANKKLKPNEKLPVITSDQLKNYVELFREFMQLNGKYELLKDAVDNFIHDVNNYAADIGEKSRIINNKAQSGTKKVLNDIFEKSGNVVALNNLILTKLNSLTMINGYNNLSSIKLDFNFFKSFDSIRKSLSSDTIKIIVDSNKHISDIEATQEVKYIPYSIIENSIKYIPVTGKKVNEIIVYIEELSNKQIITISSLGPYLEHDEYDKIYVKGYRGRNCRSTVVRGTGIGMTQMKNICDDNNFKLEVSSDDKIELINNIPYSMFTIRIIIENI